MSERSTDPFLDALKRGFGSTLGRLAALILVACAIAGGVSIWLQVPFLTALIICGVTLVILWAASFFLFE